MSESYQQGEPQFTRKMACEFINATPALQSLLYDVNLLPEIALSNEDERRMMLIVVHWREAERIRDELREGMCSAADYAKGVEAERDEAKRSLSDVTSRAERAEKLLREAFNAMDEVRVTLVDRADHSGISSVLAMTLADSQRDIKAFQEGKQ